MPPKKNQKTAKHDTFVPPTQIITDKSINIPPNKSTNNRTSSSTTSYSSLKLNSTYQHIKRKSYNPQTNKKSNHHTNSSSCNDKRTKLHKDQGFFRSLIDNAILSPSSTKTTTSLLSPSQQPDNHINNSSSFDNSHSSSQEFDNPDSSTAPSTSNRIHLQARGIVNNALNIDYNPIQQINNQDHSSPDTSIFDKQEELDSQPRDTVFLSGSSAALELYNIIDKHNLPRSVYDEIRTWAMHNFDDANKNSFLNFESLKKEMTEMTGLDDIQPIQSTITLPSGHRYNQVSIDFLSSIRSLLTDKDIMHPKNLLFKGDSPFNQVSLPNSTTYADLDTGSWYYNAEQYVVREYVEKKNIGNAVLLPLIFFFDGTTIDQRSAQTL